jgi:hypothetical protein
VKRWLSINYVSVVLKRLDQLASCDKSGGFSKKIKKKIENFFNLTLTGA